MEDVERVHDSILLSRAGMGIQAGMWILDGCWSQGMAAFPRIKLGQDCGFWGRAVAPRQGCGSQGYVGPSAELWIPGHGCPSWGRAGCDSRGRDVVKRVRMWVPGKSCDSQIMTVGPGTRL